MKTGVDELKLIRAKRHLVLKEKRNCLNMHNFPYSVNLLLVKYAIWQRCLFVFD